MNDSWKIVRSADAPTKQLGRRASNERQLSPLCSQEKLGCLEIIYIKSTLWMSVSLVYREKTPTYRSMQKKDFKTTKKEAFFQRCTFL